MHISLSIYVKIRILFIVMLIKSHNADLHIPLTIYPDTHLQTIQARISVDHYSRYEFLVEWQ